MKLQLIILALITSLFPLVTPAKATPMCDASTANTDTWVVDSKPNAIAFLQSIGIDDAKICVSNGVEVVQFARTSKGSAPNSYDYLNLRDYNPRAI